MIQGDIKQTQSVSLPNFAADGFIGAAASTVDLAACVQINQTTTGRELTLPAPTDSSQVIELLILNNGTAAFKMAMSVIAPKAAFKVFWSPGAAQWMALTSELSDFKFFPDFTALTPVTIANNTNNWNPAGLATTVGYDLTNTGIPNNLTGILAPSPVRQQQVWIYCRNGAPGLVLKNEDGGSTAANRIITPANIDYALSAGQNMLMVYIPALSRWVVGLDSQDDV